jgi:hypothetical protein
MAVNDNSLLDLSRVTVEIDVIHEADRDFLADLAWTAATAVLRAVGAQVDGGGSYARPIEPAAQ